MNVGYSRAYQFQLQQEFHYAIDNSDDLFVLKQWLHLPFPNVEFIASEVGDTVELFIYWHKENMKPKKKKTQEIYSMEHAWEWKELMWVCGNNPMTFVI